MAGRKDQAFEERALAWLDRHWKLVVVLVWLGLCAWFYVSKTAEIRLFALPDTDDNLRMAQVRAWMKGQDWYDLRQYRLNPPAGANIHWSRLVDLPLAGLILLFRPFLGGPGADRMAVAIAPMLPYLLLLFSVALTVRRLIDPRAYVLAFLAMFFAASTNGMFAPLRIDHHGWQLAILALGVSGLADPNRSRGGLVFGLATALSLAIGLEMLIYFAIGAAATVLIWVGERDERERLRAYAVALGGGTTVGFLLFASNDNWNAVCDALSPVWLADALLGGALLFGLAMLSPADWKRRLALAVAAGVVVVIFHAIAAPHCLQRLEGVSPEVERLWLSHVREARPIYRHGWRIASLVVTLPITGAIGWALLVWVRRRDRELLPRVLAVAAPALAATLLLLWQTRTGPAAQMLGTIGAAALLWFLVPRLWNAGSSVVRVLGVTALVLVGAGAAVPLALNYVPSKAATPREKAIGRANRLCGSLPGLRPIALQPKGVVFTFVDTGPRLISTTHHSSITGPYHRNGEQIADVMNAFRGDADQARRIVTKYRSDYLLICPNSSTTTIFTSEAPTGFYVQLAKGRVPAWLTPVPLPVDSPFKLWRVTG